MKQLIYGTKNKSKIEFMRDMLAGMDVNIAGVNEMDIDLPDVEENGRDIIENAVIKAKAYYEIVKSPVFSADTGLYLMSVEDDEQPGTEVRRANGKRMSDVEMQEYYRALASKYGGRITAKYKNAIAVAIDYDRVLICEDDGINSKEFYIVDTPYGTISEGFPIDGISVEIESGRYYNQIDNTKYKYNNKEAFQKFFGDILRFL